MSVITCSLQGRFGNQMMQYIFCRALSERMGSELRMAPWVGEQVFEMSHPRPDAGQPRRMNEAELFSAWHKEFGNYAVLRDRVGDIDFRGYAQMQSCMIYTRKQVKEWLTLRTEVEAPLQRMLAHKYSPIVGHRRGDDYAPLGYVVCSAASYRRACREYGLREEELCMVSDEHPTVCPGLPDDIGFMADFYRMMKAKVLLRGNSSFSWLAALLSDALVLSPVIDGLVGGADLDVNFVPGNWPKFANLDFISDLHVREI